MLFCRLRKTEDKPNEQDWISRQQKETPDRQSLFPRAEFTGTLALALTAVAFAAHPKIAKRRSGVENHGSGDFVRPSGECGISGA